MTTKNDTPKITIGEKELDYTELSDTSKYYHSQLLDLIDKRNKLQFQIDQINMSINGFDKLFVDSTSETVEEKINEDEKDELYN